MSLQNLVWMPLQDVSSRLIVIVIKPSDLDKMLLTVDSSRGEASSTIQHEIHCVIKTLSFTGNLLVWKCSQPENKYKAAEA